MNIFFKILLLVIPFSLFADLNDDFILHEMANIDKLTKNANFLDGEVYFGKDTIKAKILDFKNKSNRNFYLFIVVKEDDGSLKYYTAKEIIGYNINNEYFKRIQNGTDYFFIHRTNRGKITLFERKKIPSEPLFLYFLIKEDNTYVLDPSESDIDNEFNVVTGDGGVVTVVEFKGLDIIFQSFVNNVMFECDKVGNLVKSGFYTINDLPYLVDTYHACIEEN